MKVSEFNFELPEELIAQEALEDRTASKLLVMDRDTGEITDSVVKDLGSFLRPGDLLVVNNSRVLPARLLGQLNDIKVECFLLKRIDDRTWEGLVKPGKKINSGDVIVCARDNKELRVKVLEKLPDGKVMLSLIGDNPEDLLQKVGHMPLPPYIKRPDSLTDKERYQTVYSKNLGSVAAPTAGLHFTPELIVNLKSQGIDFTEITLHVGYGTFKPVRVENVEDHVIDPEAYEISPESAEKINQALSEGKRVIAVGTTTTRVLEYSAHNNNGKVKADAGFANLFIYPGYEFQVISGLMTNFHLPESSLLMLVCALGGQENILKAYGHAVSNKYRFYSYGDAMLIVSLTNGQEKLKS